MHSADDDNLTAEKAKTLAQQALQIEPVEVDSYCVGDRWVTHDLEQLAKLIAIIAMGQSLHAAKIIHALEVAEPVLAKSALKSAAKGQLRINGTTEDEKLASRWRRDGFLFEAISWIAARQANGEKVLLNDPHLKSTTQGIDGLMIEWDSVTTEVVRATILEDKCSEHPRKIFRDDVLPAFKNHHANQRGPELVSIAASLIAKKGVDGTLAVAAATRVLDVAYRRYRAALAITGDDDSVARRMAVFKGYSALEGIDSEQRVAATFVVDGPLREYFDMIASAAMAAIDNWKDADV